MTEPREGYNRIYVIDTQADHGLRVIDTQADHGIYVIDIQTNHGEFEFHSSDLFYGTKEEAMMFADNRAKNYFGDEPDYDEKTKKFIFYNELFVSVFSVYKLQDEPIHTYDVSWDGEIPSVDFRGIMVDEK